MMGNLYTSNQFIIASTIGGSKVDKAFVACSNFALSSLFSDSSASILAKSPMLSSMCASSSS